MGEDAPMLALHRYVRAALQAIPECLTYVDVTWPQALRWIALLGFKPTGVVMDLGGVPHGVFSYVRP